MKKRMLVLMLVLMAAVLMLAACGGKGETGMQIPNPWTEAESLEAAAETAGYAFTVPASAEEAQDLTVRLMNGGEITQVDYTLEGRAVTLRKGPGEESISGVYTEYENKTTGTAGDAEVTLQGNGDTVSLAEWTAEGYSFCIFCEEGLAAEDILAMAAEMA